tara:strand:- start:633 stop:917 length:285 start_codon:yes stop_codon:yes gene_type:complete
MFTKSLGEIIKKENGSAMKILLPLLHKLSSAMLAEMKKKDIDISWYQGSLENLFAAWAFELYDNPEKDFLKYSKMVDDNYEKFEKKIMHEEAQA